MNSATPGHQPAHDRCSLPSRTGLRATGGFVLLASFALPAVITPAAAAEAPVPLPSGWVDASTSGFDPNFGGDKEWWAPDGTLRSYTTAPEINPAYLDVFYSTDRVALPGDRIDFIISLRRVENYVPRPQEAPGVRGNTRAAASGLLKLGDLLDDVEALRIEDFTGTAEDLALLNLEFTGDDLRFLAHFPAGREVITFRFSATYLGTGDNHLEMPTHAWYDGTHYGTLLESKPVITVAEPPLEVVKRGSRTEVTEKGQEVTWTVDVTRPAGNSTDAYELLDDFSGVQDDVDPVRGTEVRRDGRPVTTGLAWTADSFSYLGSFGALSSQDQTQTFTYTVRYRGAGDGRLVNQACATAQQPLKPTTPTDPVCAQSTVSARTQPSTSPSTSPSSPVASSGTASPTSSASSTPTSGADASSTPPSSPGPEAEISGHGGGPLPDTGAEPMTGWLLGAGAALLGGVGLAAQGRRGRRGRHS